MSINTSSLLFNLFINILFMLVSSYLFNKQLPYRILQQPKKKKKCDALLIPCYLRHNSNLCLLVLLSGLEPKKENLNSDVRNMKN